MPAGRSAEARRKAVRRAVDLVEALFPLACVAMVLVILAGLLQLLI